MIFWLETKGASSQVSFFTRVLSSSHMASFRFGSLIAWVIEEGSSVWWLKNIILLYDNQLYG